jgi:uncharacterized NAD-dependent epimerase/dehydratase family protein
MFKYKKPIAILSQGKFGVLEAKTATCILRYRSDEVCAVIDSATAGQTCDDIVGFACSVPIVASVSDAADRGAATLLIGVAPQGGQLPPEWRGYITEAIERGWDIVSGLHTFLSMDSEFSMLAKRSGSSLIDLRLPPRDINIGSGRARDLGTRILMTVGSDCDVGKMTVTYELVEEARTRGIKTAFVATGQTGIFLSKWGVAVDAVPADFVAGATEAMVIEAARTSDLVVVEGQGSLVHPGYSGVTLGLLHGGVPHGMVLCHEVGRRAIKDMPNQEIPPMRDLIALYEHACEPIRPAAVTSIALNCFSLDEDACTQEIARTERETGLPATDCIRFGSAVLLDSFLERYPLR